MTKEGRHSKFLIKAAIVALFILGHLVIMCGFLIEYADDVPWVYKLIAPTYSRASQGTRQLVESSGHTLGYHDVGFCEVSNILSNHFVDIQTNLPGGNGHLINIVQIS